MSQIGDEWVNNAEVDKIRKHNQLMYKLQERWKENGDLHLFEAMVKAEQSKMYFE